MGREAKHERIYARVDELVPVSDRNTPTNFNQFDELGLLFDVHPKLIRGKNGGCWN